MKTKKAVLASRCYNVDEGEWEIVRREVNTMAAKKKTVKKAVKKAVKKVTKKKAVKKAVKKTVKKVTKKKTAKRK